MCMLCCECVCVLHVYACMVYVSACIVRVYGQHGRNVD